MCGIAGFCDFSNQGDELLLRKMTDTLVHRGPDDSGYKVMTCGAATVGLGHRRLSIIDLSPLGHQPMTLGPYEIIYNGEIYNFAEVKKELELGGFTFRTHSDTEVILAGFSKWGIDVLQKFVGMFAFVLLDKDQQKLFLVRDRIGVKPMYHYYHNNTFLFASELKAFHQHPAFTRQINFSALATFFQFGYVQSPETIFENARQLKPGHYLEVDLAQKTFDEKCYWRIEDFFGVKVKMEEEAILSELESLLTSSVNYRMVADVPVGLFLSGGYDSSTVAALLQKGRTEKIRTFTIGFEESEFNEAPHAKKIADFLGTDHTEYYCSAKEAEAIVTEIPFYFDEPFADDSAVPTMLVSKLARKNVTVALSADGGDELFGGYPKYLSALKYRRLRSLLPNAAAGAVGKSYDFLSKLAMSGSQKLRGYEALSNKVGELIRSRTATDYARIVTQQFEEKSLTALVNRDLINKGRLFYNREFFKPFAPLDQLILLDFKVFLPDDLMVKVDRAAMSVSLEGREPLLDHRMIEFMGKIDANSKINDGNKTTKYYLKQIAHKHIPEHMLNRPKMGFSSPVLNWLKTSLKDKVDYYLAEDRIVRQGIVNYTVIQQAKDDFFKRGYAKASKKLWNMLMFQMWYEKWMTQ